MKMLVQAPCILPQVFAIILVSACNGDKKGGQTPDSGEHSGMAPDTAEDSDTPVNKSSCNGDYWVQVTTGTYLTCGLDNEGCADCWGSSGVERDTGHSPWEPSGDDMPPDEIFTQISLPKAWPAGGGWNGCGLTLDQRAVCWGDVEEPPVGDFSFVGAGKYSGCALDLHGFVSCWGNNGNEVVGLSSEPFLRLSVGEISVCGILADQTLSCGSAWFSPEYIAPPEGKYIDVDTSYQGSACALSEAGDIVCWDGYDKPWEYEGDQSFVDLEEGFDYCLLDVEGRISCIYGDYMPPDKVYTQMDLGIAHGCAVDIEGNIECWGPDNGTGAQDVPLLHE